MWYPALKWRAIVGGLCFVIDPNTTGVLHLYNLGIIATHLLMRHVDTGSKTVLRIRESLFFIR
jgi:hypothetical protein